MPSTHWIEKTVITSALFAIPAIGFLISAYVHRRRKERKLRTHPVYFTTLAAVLLFVYSVINIVFQLSVEFMVAWTLFGIALTFLGIGLAFSTSQSERWRLVIANLLLLILTLASIVAPN